MSTAPQNPTVDGRDFVLNRGHRLIVEAEAVLAREPARFTLTAGQAGVHEELRDSSLPGLDRDRRRICGPQGAAGPAIAVGGRSGMALLHQALGQPLLDVSRIL